MHKKNLHGICIVKYIDLQSIYHITKEIMYVNRHRKDMLSTLYTGK